LTNIILEEGDSFGGGVHMICDEAVNIVETTPIDECRYFLIGVPDVGLAGSIALSYVIQEKEMNEVGYLESDAFPPVLVVHDGEPRSPFRLYRKDDVIAMISEIPIELKLLPKIARSIVDWAKSKGVELLITLSGIAVQNRLDIEIPKVYCIASSPSVKNISKSLEIDVFEEGFITGLHAIVMKESLKKNVPNMILLVQSHLQYPDPGAAASLITSFSKLLDWEMDIKNLLTQEEEIRLQLRELMQRTQQQMLMTQKGREQEIPHMYVS
jgi:uncharacterized protein